MLGWGLGNIDAMAVVGDDVFVASTGQPSGPADFITEVDASTGARVRVISGPQYGFNQGEDGMGMVATGDDLFVANSATDQESPSGQGALTEVDASTGKLVRMISGAAYDFGMYPGPMATDGRHVFVAASGSVDEIDASTGRLVRLIGDPAYPFQGITGMTVDGADLFVANDPDEMSSTPPGTAGWVAEVDIRTGEPLRVIAGAGYRFDVPEAIGASVGKVFVTNAGAGVVTEVDAATGSLDKVMSAPGLSFPQPDAGLVASTHDVFVTASRADGDEVVAEFDSSKGTFVRSFPAGMTFGDDAAFEGVGVDGPYLLFPTLGEVPDQIATCADQGMVSDAVSEFDLVTGALVRVLSGSPYRFGTPSAMVAGGGHVFVADEGGEPASVTELSGSTGSLERVIAGPEYRFGAPSALALAGRRLFVVDEAPPGVTEIDAPTGSLLRVFSGPAYRFGAPDAILVRGHDVFVANPDAPDGGSVTEFDSSTGAVVRVLAGNRYQFGSPGALAVSGHDLFVANTPQVVDNGTVTEVDLVTGAPVRVLSRAITDEEGPSALAALDGHVFVANSLALTELDASTGAVVRVVPGIGVYAGSNAIVVDGPDVFVAHCSGGSVGELDASTGGTRVISGWTYPLACPDAVAFSEAHLFVANACGGTVTEIMFKPSHN
jgi:hypothetical protein